MSMAVQTCFERLPACVEIVWSWSTRRQYRSLSDAVVDQIDKVDGRSVDATSASVSGSLRRICRPDRMTRAGTSSSPLRHADAGFKTSKSQQSFTDASAGLGAPQNVVLQANLPSSIPALVQNRYRQNMSAVVYTRSSLTGVVYRPLCPASSHNECA